MKRAHDRLLGLAFVASLAACGTDGSTLQSAPSATNSSDPAASQPAGDDAGAATDTARAVSAKELFLSSAEPLLRPTCNGCHATGSNAAPIFLGATPEASYTAITSNAVPGLIAAPINSKLLAHGAHLGPALVQAQVDAVTQWLDAEVKERGLDATPAYTEATALAEFAACMRFDDFGGGVSGGDNGGLGGQFGLPGAPGGPGFGGGSTYASVADAETETEGACRACHNTGDGTFWASSGTVAGADLTRVMFDRTKETPYIRQLVKGTVDASGKFLDLVASHAIVDKSAAAATCLGPSCHPKFTLSDQQAKAIGDFVDATLQRWRNKQCAQASDAGTD
jgi:hypothetical protein